MQFEVEGVEPIDGVTPEQVEQGLMTLRPDGGPTFAILALDSNSYIQTMEDGDGTFVLEYQDGSLDRHYRVAQSLPIEAVTAAFRSYLRQDDGWRYAHEWEPMDLS